MGKAVDLKSRLWKSSKGTWARNSRARYFDIWVKSSPGAEACLSCGSGCGQGLQREPENGRSQENMTNWVSALHKHKILEKINFTKRTSTGDRRAAEGRADLRASAVPAAVWRWKKPTETLCLPSFPGGLKHIIFSQHSDVSNHCGNDLICVPNASFSWAAAHRFIDQSMRLLLRLFI